MPIEGTPISGCARSGAMVGRGTGRSAQSGAYELGRTDCDGEDDRESFVS
jgi:hypothetical protein